MMKFLIYNLLILILKLLMLLMKILKNIKYLYNKNKSNEILNL